MTIDPRTPVLVGYGQVNQREESATTEPVDLMEAAARAAADPRVLAAVDSIRVVNLLSWRYRDAGLLLAQRIGADGAATRYTPIGGNVPQSLVNQACLDIQAGRNDAVLITGGETWRSRTRVRGRGEKMSGTKQDESVAPAPGSEDEFNLFGPGRCASVWTDRRTCTPCSSRRCASSPVPPRPSTSNASVNCGRGSALWRRRIRTPGTSRR